MPDNTKKPIISKNDIELCHAKFIASIKNHPEKHDECTGCSIADALNDYKEPIEQMLQNIITGFVCRLGTPLLNNANILDLTQNILMLGIDMGYEIKSAQLFDASMSILEERK